MIGERKRRISGQMTGRLVTRDRRRAVWLDDTEVALSVAHEGGRIMVYFIEDGVEGPGADPGFGLEAGRAGVDRHRSTASRSLYRCARFPTASCSRMAASR